MFAREKHYSLFHLFINDEKKGFIIMTESVSVFHGDKNKLFKDKHSSLTLSWLKSVIPFITILSIIRLHEC